MSLPTNVEAELGRDNFPIGSKISLCKAGVILFSCLFLSWPMLKPNTKFILNGWKMEDDLKVYVNEGKPQISK